MIEIVAPLRQGEILIDHIYYFYFCAESSENAKAINIIFKKEDGTLWQRHVEINWREAKVRQIFYHNKIRYIATP